MNEFFFFFASLQRWLSCPAAGRILVPWPGIKPTCSALEDKFLTTGPPGKSLNEWLNVPPYPHPHAWILFHWVELMKASVGGKILGPVQRSLSNSLCVQGNIGHGSSSFSWLWVNWVLSSLVTTFHLWDVSMPLGWTEQSLLLGSRGRMILGGRSWGQLGTHLESCFLISSLSSCSPKRSSEPHTFLSWTTPATFCQVIRTWGQKGPHRISGLIACLVRLCWLQYGFPVLCPKPPTLVGPS